MRRCGTYLTVAFLLALTACTRRELYVPYDEGADIIVYADWSLTPLSPEGWTAMFYPVGGGTPTRKVTNFDSVKVNLPPGAYHILVFNETLTDFDDIVFSDVNDYDRFTAYVPKEQSGLYDISEPPEILATWTREDFVVTDEMVTTTHLVRAGEYVSPSRLESLRVRSRPRVITATIHLRANITRLNKATSLGGYLNGFAAAVRMCDGHPSDSTTAYRITFEDRIFTSQTDGYVEAALLSFGFRNGEADALSGYTFDLRAALIDGSAYRERIDICNSITHHEGTYRDTVINIVTPSFILPDVQGKEGWIVDIGSWDGENVPIRL